jgi:hypothetical protein
VWCFAVDTSGANATATKLSGLYYSAAAQALQGTADCP